MSETIPLLRPLTPMQRRVSVCIGAGLSYKQTAKELGIGVGTVKEHVRAISYRLDNPQRLPQKSLVQLHFGARE